jgi:hypothetical protein
MIINKHEAASTKAALQDIGQHFGDAVFIISNTRLEGRNVVYFATESTAAQPEPLGRTSLLHETSHAPQNDLSALSISTGTRKTAARKRKNAVTIMPSQVLESKPHALTDTAALEQQVDEMKRLLAETTGAMMKADIAATSRFECLEQLQRKQKSGIDQLNRRLARQTELLSRMLASLETRQLPESLSGATGPAAPQVGYRGETVGRNDCHLLTYLKNNGSFYDVAAFSSGIHTVLTDSATGTVKAVQEFSQLLLDSAIGTLPCIIRFTRENTPVLSSAGVEIAAEEKDLEKSMAAAGRKRPIVVFISTRDYLNSTREFKCLAGANVHCFYTHGSALEQLAFLGEVHRLRPLSLSITAVPPPSRGLPEFFSLLTAGVPVLFMAGGKLPLSRPDAIIPTYLGNKSGSNPIARMTSVLNMLSVTANLTTPCKNILRKLAGRIMNMTETADAQ